MDKSNRISQIRREIKALVEEALEITEEEAGIEEVGGVEIASERLDKALSFLTA